MRKYFPVYREKHSGESFINAHCISRFKQKQATAEIDLRACRPKPTDGFFFYVRMKFTIQGQYMQKKKK